MSMAVHGALAAFNPREEDWSEYSESPRQHAGKPIAEYVAVLRKVATSQSL